MKITLDLGMMLDDGYVLNGFCRACGMNKRVDLARACEKFGRDHSGDLRGKLRCECGSKAIGLRLGGPQGTNNAPPL